MSPPLSFPFVIEFSLTPETLFKEFIANDANLLKSLAASGQVKTPPETEHPPSLVAMLGDAPPVMLRVVVQRGGTEVQQWVRA